MYYCKWLDKNTIALMKGDDQVAYGKLDSSESDKPSGQIVSESLEYRVVASVLIRKEAPHVRWYL